MPARLRFNRFDAEFAARSPVDVWQRLVALRDHPRFLDGVQFYDEVVPEVFADNIILSKAVTEIRRFQMIVYTLHLYDTRHPDDPTSGLTLSRLNALCRKDGLASTAGVTTFLGMLQIAGYLRRERSRVDSRIVHFVPTEKFIAIIHRWTDAILRTLDVVEPDGRLSERHMSHPRFGWDMREEAAQQLLAGWRPLDPFPEVQHFLDCPGGWMLLCHTVAVMLHRGGESIVPVAIDLAAFGRRFGVSRSHLRRLLEGAYAKGLLDAAPYNGRQIVLSERLLAACMSAQAAELSTYRMAARSTQQTLA
jgi:hypothetical protein